MAIFNVALSQAQIQTVMAGDFSAFVPRPQLSVSSSAGNIVLSWPAAQATFQLQSTATLAPASWANVANAPVPTGGMLTVTLPDRRGNAVLPIDWTLKVPIGRARVARIE